MAMGIQKYVFYSIHNCDKHPEVPLMEIKHCTEKFLQDSGLTYIIIRLCGFMQVICHPHFSDSFHLQFNFLELTFAEMICSVGLGSAISWLINSRIKASSPILFFFGTVLGTGSKPSWSVGHVPFYEIIFPLAQKYPCLKLATLFSNYRYILICLYIDL